MAVLDQFRLKVDGNDAYNKNGTIKSLREIHTHNGILFPQNNLDNYLHPILKTMGANPNGYKYIQTTDSTRFVNASEGIDFLFDKLEDAKTPLVSGKLKKNGVDYPIMHPYMVAVLDNFSKAKSRTAYADGSYTMNRYGGVDNALKNSGIIEIQGAGGGSGGTNNVSADCAGGGGGAGGYAAIYYRIKNTNATISMTITKGIGGDAGGSGSGDGGGGTASSVAFMVNGNYDLQYSIVAGGGFGGQTGNYNYTNGGDGGIVAYVDVQKGTGIVTLATGGLGGTSSRSPSAGSVAGGQVLFDNEYLFVYLLGAQGGAGGGRGDDTDGNCQGQAGAGTSAMVLNKPYSNGNTSREIPLTARTGGARGSNVSDSAPGGGGASVLSNGANGGTTSTSGNAGSLGAGAGGACCGNNANRPGSKGGDGVIYFS